MYICLSQENTVDDTWQELKDSDKKTLAFGHMALIMNQIYFTDAMLAEFDIVHRVITITTGDCIYLHPGSLYQSVTNTAGRSSTIRSLTRSSMWKHIGGLQAIIAHLDHRDTYTTLSVQLRSICSDEDSTSVAAALDRQFPTSSIETLLRSQPPIHPAARDAELGQNNSSTEHTVPKALFDAAEGLAKMLTAFALKRLAPVEPEDPDEIPNYSDDIDAIKVRSRNNMID